MPTNVQTTSSSITINRTLRNTYQLLSATLLFSGLMAYLSMYLNLPYFGLLITLGGYFGLLFLVTKLRNSASGILAVFALTGFMGLTLGPIIGPKVRPIKPVRAKTARIPKAEFLSFVTKNNRPK